MTPLSPLAESFTPRPTPEERQTQQPHTDKDLDWSLAKTGSSKIETPRDGIKCKIATIGTACPIEIGKPVARRRDVQIYIKSCTICIARKSPCPRRVPMGHVEVGQRWERVAMDLLDMSVTTARGNRYVLVMVDCFTRWPEAYPLPDKTAQSVADAFFNQVVCHFGMPSVIHSVKEKIRETVDSLFRINERVARVDSAITNQHLSSDFYDLKHFAHADCLKWKLNLKHRYLPMYAWD